MQSKNSSFTRHCTAVIGLNHKCQRQRSRGRGARCLNKVSAVRGEPGNRIPPTIQLHEMVSLWQDLLVFSVQEGNIVSSVHLECPVSLSIVKRLMSAEEAHPKGLQDYAIQEYALRLRPPEYAQIGWLDDLLSMLGGYTIFNSSLSADAPFLIADGQRNFCVHLPPDNIVSQRGLDWFLAMAIGHMQLHWPPRGGWSKVSDILWVARTPVHDFQKMARSEAIRFAFELLLPTPEMSAALEKHGLDRIPEILKLRIHPNVIHARMKNAGMH